jgi:hypothetical protein
VLKLLLPLQTQLLLLLLLLLLVLLVPLSTIVLPFDLQMLATVNVHAMLCAASSKADRVLITEQRSHCFTYHRLHKSICPFSCAKECLI